MIDALGARFVALLTAIALAAVLVTGSPWLLLFQAAVFAVGALGGLPASPYAALYRYAVGHHVAGPRNWDDPAPTRFAQSVGLALALAGLAGFGLGLPTLTVIAVGGALAAAFLNAAVGVCLACEVYVVVRRDARGVISPGTSPAIQEVSA